MKTKICHVKYEGELVPASVRTNSDDRVFRTPEYKSFKEICSWLAKASYSGDVIDNRFFAINIKIHQRSGVGRGHHLGRGDIDNLLKPIIDSLTGIIWKDDQQLIELHCSIKRDAPASNFEMDVFDIGAWHNYKVLVKCGNCGEEFQVIKYRTRQAKVLCCSRKCLYELHHKELTCIQCGKHFYRKKSAEGGIKFCCSECYWQYTREHPEEFPHWGKALTKANLVLKSRRCL